MSKQYREYLHLFVLVAFAVAQPIYDLLGKNPEFLVAHAAQPTLIIIMMVVLSFGLATILVLAELVACLFGERMRGYSHLLFVFLLVILIAMPLVKKFSGEDILIISSTVLMSLIFTYLYDRVQGVRLFVILLLPAVIAFPLLFAFTTPVSSLIHTTGDKEYNAIIKNKAPVLVVIFDELNTTALLDNENEIDSVRFPNFSSIAKDSWWFKNATASYFTTVQALPAILTGNMPQIEKGHIPTTTNYPRNLFALLENEYQIFTNEPVTDFHRKDNTSIDKNQYLSLLFDVTAIYLHLTAPPIIEKKLPNLGAQWTGLGEFLRNNQDDQAGNEIAQLKGWESRDLQIDRILSKINKTDLPVLHFMHVLLPHVPYEFLSTGHKYIPSANYPFPDGLIKTEDDWVWNNESLAVTSYHQYLQQIGYADKFLGRLKERLELIGLYDQALILVTADHGVSFRHGSPQRKIDDKNGSDILSVPMLIKLPGQRKHHTNEHLVNSIDILPTIIDILDIDVSWKMDGYSVFSDEILERNKLDIPSIGIINIENIDRTSSLDWKLKYFGSGTKLSQITPFDQHRELIGKDVSHLQFKINSDLVLSSEDLDYFELIDIESKFLPALFKGQIKGAGERRLAIALSVNNVIRSTTTTSIWGGVNNYFSVLFPPESFKNGYNKIDIYTIENINDSLHLSLVHKEDHPDPKILSRNSGGDFLQYPNQREVALDTHRNNMDGYLDWLTLKDGMLVFEGWAADLVEKQPASDILIFKGDKLVWRVAPAYIRKRVAKALNWPKPARCGYRANIPLEILEPGSGDISLVAISKDKRAFRIHIKDLHRELIRTSLIK